MKFKFYLNFFPATLADWRDGVVCVISSAAGTVVLESSDVLSVNSASVAKNLAFSGGGPQVDSTMVLPAPPLKLQSSDFI